MSQIELENGFYMVDIPYLLKKKRQSDVEDYILQMRMTIATNQRVMEDEQYKEFITELMKNIESSSSNNEATGEKFDRQAFETLRFMTKQGANFLGRG